MNPRVIAWRAQPADAISVTRADKGLCLPVHGYLLNVNGIYLIENLDLEEFARDKVREFAFIVEPLDLRGATGSSVAPIAVR